MRTVNNPRFFFCIRKAKKGRKQKKNIHRRFQTTCLTVPGRAIGNKMISRNNFGERNSKEENCKCSSSAFSLKIGSVPVFSRIVACAAEKDARSILLVPAARIRAHLTQLTDSRIFSANTANQGRRRCSLDSLSSPNALSSFIVKGHPIEIGKSDGAAFPYRAASMNDR